MLFFLQLERNYQTASYKARLHPNTSALILETTLVKYTEPKPYKWAEICICIYVQLPICKKQIHTYANFWDTTNPLRSITLGMPDHSHLKLLNMFVTSMDP